ncbi:MAG: hypothetical protein QOF21_1572 [Actinomycetota bacterium]
MTRVVIDPAELAALSALCRNASYDVAGVATEAQYRMDAVMAMLGVDGARLHALVDHAASLLHRVAVDLDGDALAVATLGQRGAAADALGDLGGNEHGLLTRLNITGENNE